MKLESYERQVNPNLGPGGGVTNVGGQQASASMAIPGGLQPLIKGLGDYAKYQMAVMDKDMALEKMNAETDYNARIAELLHNQDNGIMNTSLDGAKTAVQDFATAEKQIREDVMKGIAYKNNQEAFGQYANQSTIGNLKMVETHAHNEKKKYIDVSYQNSVNTVQKIAELNPTNIDLVKSQLDNLKNHTLALFHDEGEEYVKSRWESASADVVKGMLASTVGNNDIEGTQKVLDYAKELGVAPHVYKQVESATREKLLNNIAMDDKSIDDIASSNGYDRDKTAMAIEGKLTKVASMGVTPNNANPTQWHAAKSVQAEIKRVLGIDADLGVIYAQMAHESSDGSRASGLSRLAEENHNYGGLTQVEPNGEENKQPDGTNYYMNFKNDDEYAKAYVANFLKHYPREELAKALKDPKAYAHLLKAQGYYTADEGEYASSMQSIYTKVHGEGALSDGDRQKIHQQALDIADKAIARHEVAERKALNDYVDNTTTTVNMMIANGQSVSDIKRYIQSRIDNNPKSAKVLSHQLATYAVQERKEAEGALKANELNMQSLKSMVASGASAEAINKVMEDSGLHYTPSQVADVYKAIDDRNNGRGVYSPELQGVKQALINEGDLDKGTIESQWPSVGMAVMGDVNEWKNKHPSQRVPFQIMVDFAKKALRSSSLGTIHNRVFEKDVSIELSPAQLASRGYSNAKLVTGADGQPYVVLTTRSGVEETHTPEDVKQLFGLE